MTKNIGLILAAALIAVLPSLSYASTFAFVNHLGNVSTVTADTSGVALMTAVNIDEHSGVILLLNTQDYGIVGDHTPGV